MSAWTVKDLIKELEKYPQDMHVEVNSFEGEAPIQSVDTTDYINNEKMVRINPYI